MKNSNANGCVTILGNVSRITVISIGNKQLRIM